MKRVYIVCLLFMGSFHCLYSQNGEITYKTYCGGCHGAQMQGGTASKLIKTDWKYGRGKGTIFRNIKFGIEGTEMIAWGKVLKDEEIGAVADFIIKSQELPPMADRPIPETLTSKDYTLRIEKLVSAGIRVPWGIEFVDKEKAVITERNGSIRWMINGKLDPQPITGLPKTFVHNTGGYMDIAIDPSYSKNGWVYFAFSHTKGDTADEKATGMTKVIRGKIEDHQWTEEQTLFEVADTLKIPGGNRWGSRLLFDKAGYLFFSIGDMARGMDSQNPGKPTGKVFRINADGSIPKDNPYAGRKDVLQAIFSIGNRNVQGIAQHPATGELWATEHGPMGGDELNILKKGANYGWPIITYGVDYDGSIVSTIKVREGMEQPITQWTPSIGVCPAEFVTGNVFPSWKNNLLVGSLAFEEIRRLVIDKNKIVEEEILMKGVGRVRDLKIGPDGALYVLLNAPDMILRITAEKKP
ncbi:MAG TPA: PQQ-dependent sugar dehydrogenase [Chryseolinea sp.]